MARSELDFADVVTWLDAVADGSLTMSQRKLERLTRVTGGLASVTAAATERGVHLAVFVDDHGVELVAASRDPIRVLC